MIALNIILTGDKAFADWQDREIIHLANGAPALRVACLEGGTASGAPSVALGFELPDGKVVIAETTLKLFLTAADVLRAKYGDPRT